MRVCGARSWTPQGCIRKTDRYRAVLVAWWVSVARVLTMPPTHCGPVISLHPCRCGAIVIVDVVCCGPVAIPAVGVHACARSRSAASSSALSLRAISLSPVSGALVFSRAAERGSLRDSARAMRRSSRAYRPQVAMTPKHAPITTPQARASWVSTAASPFNPLRPAYGAHASCGDFYSDFLRATYTSTAALRSRVAPATMRTFIQAGILGTP